MDNLDALKARGPWLTQEGAVTPRMVEATLHAILHGKDIATEIETARAETAPGDRMIVHVSDRRADRALQLLRKASLVRFNRRSRRWERR
jgi:hypothetical protein